MRRVCVVLGKEMVFARSVGVLIHKAIGRTGGQGKERAQDREVGVWAFGSRESMFGFWDWIKFAKLLEVKSSDFPA